MSMMVATMKKMKNGNLSGIQKHNQREFENHSNDEIDPERSDMNYDLVNDENINYKNRVDTIIDEQRTSTRAIRKDAVKVDEWIISSDREFFNSLDSEETKNYFQSVVDYFKENFGNKNVAYASVHLDETTPHMHLGVVPMKDGKLSSKTVFTREKLREIQEQLPQYLNEKGFDIERGIEGSKSKHHSTEEYKKLKETITNEQFEELSYKLDQSEKRNIVYMDMLENDFKVTSIEPDEMKARLILNKLEKGVEPRNLEQAEDWLKKLKNAVGSRIEPARLTAAISKVTKFIQMFMKLIQNMSKTL